MPKVGWRTVSVPAGLLEDVRNEFDAGRLGSHTSVSAFVEYAVRKELDRAREHLPYGNSGTKRETRRPAPKGGER